MQPAASFVQAYLNEFVNYEKRLTVPYQTAFTLSRVKRLFAALEIFYQRLPVIHIAGTKGKGSVASFAAQLAAASGCRVGLYTSPHFFTVRERITVLEGTASGVTRRSISGKDIARLLASFRPVLQRLKREGITFFEILTALALQHFAQCNVDLVVLETGMGGRLDATNVVTPLVSVITAIDYDHTDSLGSTLERIAHEKAGIIKPRVPVVCAKQRPSVRRVIFDVCAKKQAPLAVLGEEFCVSCVRLRSEYTQFQYSSSLKSYDDLLITVKGRYQVDNAALALNAMECLQANGFVGAVNVREGLGSLSLPGRFERVSLTHRIVFDMAHNPVSFAVLDEAIKTYFPQKKVILIFAAAADKDIKKMLKKISFDTLILTQFKSPRCASLSYLREQGPVTGVLSTQTVREAFQEAKSVYNKDSLICVAGSLYLVAEAHRAIKQVFP